MAAKVKEEPKTQAANGGAGIPEDVQKLIARGRKLSGERYPRIALEDKAGNYLLGTYQGSRPMPNVENGLLQMFTLEQTNAEAFDWDRDTRSEVKVAVEAGKTVEIKNTTSLGRNLVAATVGKRLSIIYKGKKASEKRKGAEYHDFEIVDVTEA